MGQKSGKCSLVMCVLAALACGTVSEAAAQGAVPTEG